MARSGKYDSKFEAHLHGNCPKGCYYCRVKRPDKGLFSRLSYHQEKIPYVQPATEHFYETDFSIWVKSKKLIIEAKGRFKTREEAMKYVWLKDWLPKKYQLIFYFDSVNKAMPGAQRRKDGTKYNHGEWAEKNDFEYYDHKTYKLLEAKIK
jgi:hypothetical protein